MPHKGEVNSSYGLCLLLVFLCYRLFSLGYSQDGGDTEFEGLALMKMRSWSPAGFSPGTVFLSSKRFFTAAKVFSQRKQVWSKQKCFL